MTAAEVAKHSKTLSAPTRRAFLRTLAAAGASGSFLLGSASFVEADPSTSLHSEQAAKSVGDSIRPFHVSVPEDQLVDLRRRIAATRWPDKEPVSDKSQGVQLTTMHELARYWQDYDWRKVEARLNALPQFITNIDGVDIYFIHVRSKNPSALPMIITHGWPGSVIEQLKIIDPLTNPTAHGAKAEDSFDVVIPAIPGYGFRGSRPQPAGILSASHVPGSN
jgi:hypothetical protein